MKKPEIWISDLTHTAQGISAHTFPLGASYVYAYAKQELGKDFNFKLFKFPSDLNNELINNSSGKVIKIEEWGLLNLAYKIKNYKKGIYIHYKFEGNKNTLNEIEKKIKIDGSVIRYLTVKYKKLDTKNEYFKK